MQPVAPKWVAWVTENLLRGAAVSEVAAALANQGLDDPESFVQRIVASGELAGARRVLRRAAGVEQAARLRRHFERTAAFEVTALDEALFFHGWWSPHRPVVFRGAAESWPSWTLEDLDRRFGDVEIEVLEGREGRWYREREKLCRSIPLRDVIACMRTQTGDNLYGVGRNDVLEALPQLKDEIGSLPGIGSKPAARLWIGPEGTVTPLHHDQSGAWLVQRIGRKRVWLASPLEPALFDTADGVFNLHDPREPGTGDLSEVHWWQAVIEPGDAIFLPAGWWHMVVAESPSVSVSLGGFVWHNRFTWYTPGRVA